MTDHDITKRLAEKMYLLFEKEELHNTPEGNWSAAETTIERIVNGTYQLSEYSKFFNAEDAEYIKRKVEDTARSE
jgi:hypothetical protein